MAALGAATRTPNAETGCRDENPLQAAVGARTFRRTILLPDGTSTTQVAADDPDRGAASNAIALAFTHATQ